MDEVTLNRLVEQQLEGLRREFRAEVPASLVTKIGHDQFEKLRAQARIPDFIPVLVYRYTREGLVHARREELHRAS